MSKTKKTKKLIDYLDEEEIRLLRQDKKKLLEKLKQHEYDTEYEAYNDRGRGWRPGD